MGCTILGHEDAAPLKARIAELEAALRLIVEVPNAPSMEYAEDIRAAIVAAKMVLDRERNREPIR